MFYGLRETFTVFIKYNVFNFENTLKDVGPHGKMFISPPPTLILLSIFKWTSWRKAMHRVFETCLVKYRSCQKLSCCSDSQLSLPMNKGPCWCSAQFIFRFFFLPHPQHVFLWKEGKLALFFTLATLKLEDGFDY